MSKKNDRITDAVADAEDTSQEFTETLVRLPHTFLNFSTRMLPRKKIKKIKINFLRQQHVPSSTSAHVCFLKQNIKKQKIKN